jgi:uncharacterized membrane protein YbaN (DUF454 family)
MSISDDDDVAQGAVPGRISPDTAPRPLKRFLLQAAAGVCLVLAAIGAVLPVLPATPFVLLAAALLLRSSPALYQRMKKSRLFGRLLTDWEENQGIRLKDRLRAIAIVVGGASITLIFGNLPTWLLVTALVFVAIGVLVILSLPSAKL